MRNRITYATPVDALTAAATRLGIHENKGGMSSADFFDRYLAGEMPCEDEFMEWAMDYRNFLYLREICESLPSNGVQPNPSVNSERQIPSLLIGEG